MPTLKEIKKRIAGVRNTQKITRAMKIVATTRLKKLERMLHGGSDYMQTLTALYAELARSAYDFKHPLREPNKAAKKVAIVLISSDRGLCGAFNAQLFRSLAEFIRLKFNGYAQCYAAIGLKSQKFCAKLGKEIFYSAVRIQPAKRAEATRNAVKLATELYLQGKVTDVLLVFNGYHSRADYGFAAQHLLPFKHLEDKLDLKSERKNTRMLIEPNIGACLNKIIPLYLCGVIADAMLQSQTAEELSRMLAMDYATENAEELLQDLTLIYNRTRQAVITKELAEIVGGAEAIK